jgi:hypothetical protein
LPCTYPKQFGCAYGVEQAVPQTLVVPAPPQVCGEGHVPHEATVRG